jgi:aspartate/methionine/tyrosine aminotransferase
VIVDEVFADYPLDAGKATIEAPSAPTALTFRLGGLSKSAALPQVKLGWIGVDGPADLVGGALARLELIADTYLSVSTPVQVAAADLIEAGAPVRAAIVARVRHNYGELQALAREHPAIDVLPVEAGWSAVLRVPAIRSEEAIAIDLVERDGIVVHPGFFFDFAREAYLVISLLPDPAVFRDGVRRVLERVDD